MQRRIHNTWYIPIPTHPLFGYTLCTAIWTYAYINQSAMGFICACLVTAYSLARITRTTSQRCISLICAGAALMQAYSYEQRFLDAWHTLAQRAWILTGTVTDIRETDRTLYTIVPTTLSSPSHTLEPHVITDIPPCIIASRLQNACSIGDTSTIGPVFIRAPENRERLLYALRTGILGTYRSNRLFCKTVQCASPESLWRTLALTCARVRLTIIRGIHDHIKPHLSPRAYALFEALILGGSSTETRGEWEQAGFSQWGLMHVLARSGLHVALLLGLILSLLGLFPVSRTIRDGFAISLLIAYSLITWSSISFIRAVAMATLYWYATMRMRTPRGWYVIHLTLLIVLLYNPFILTGLDAQLSFGFSYALLWISQINRQELIFG